MGKGSDKFWELESKLPASVKPFTDRVIRTGAKVAKKLSPLGEDTQRKGSKWLRDRTGGLLGREKKRC